MTHAKTGAMKYYFLLTSKDKYMLADYLVLFQDIGYTIISGHR
jgi:hypothetical protein